MAISEGEWASIRNFVTGLIGKRGEYFITGKVVSVDKKKRLVYVKEFGTQGIPIVGFDYEVAYYDTNQVGTVIKKKAKVTLLLPKVGQAVLIAREQGVNGLPRCIGVVPPSSLWVEIPED